MTEYWVSQGKKWCDTCKLFIANNPSSIRNHELGQKHKDAVTKRLSDMRQNKADKDKKEKEAAKALEQIEAKATRSYQKDISAFKVARDLNANSLVTQDDGDGSTVAGEEWKYESSSGYYYNESNGCYYDPASGFYYTDSLGKWVTREEALSAAQASSSSVKKPLLKKPVSASVDGSVSANSQNETPPGRVVSKPLNPMRSVKGAPSSLTLNKRKREGEKPKVLSEAESAAHKAREAARKRVEEREKPLLGLYRK